MQRKGDQLPYNPELRRAELLAQVTEVGDQPNNWNLKEIIALEQEFGVNVVVRKPHRDRRDGRTRHVLAISGWRGLRGDQAVDVYRRFELLTSPELDQDRVPGPFWADANHDLLAVTFS